SLLRGKILQPGERVIDLLLTLTEIFLTGGRLSSRNLWGRLGLLDPFGLLFKTVFRLRQQALSGTLFGSQIFQPRERVVDFLLTLPQVLLLCLRLDGSWFRRCWRYPLGLFYPIGFFLQSVFRFRQ